MVTRNNMAVKSNDLAQHPILLRRPLPPKISLSKTNLSYQKTISKCLSSKKEKLQKKNSLALYAKDGAGPFDCIATNNFESALIPVKPRGPDALPARQPRKLKDNLYDDPVDERFLPSLPQFTLEQFVQRCDATSVNEQATKTQFVGRSDHDAFVRKKINELHKQEGFCKQVVDAESADLPPPRRRATRKPQRQIIFELAAVILTSDDTELDKKITGILDEVEVTFTEPGTRLHRLPHPDVARNVSSVMADTVREWSEPSGTDGGPDILQILNKHRDLAQVQKALNSKRENWPRSEILFSKSPTAFFQGTPRCSSPFPENDDSEQDIMLAAAEFVILETIVRCHATLNLKAFFIAHLPNIEPLCTKLTIINLSFNNFRIFPSQILTVKNLVSLNLRNNPLKEIPIEIGELRLLQTLVVSFCMLSCLPLSLFSLKYLKLLDLSYNRLSFLPNEIGNLRSLRELSVEGNELGALPSGILHLELHHLRLMNNFTHPLFWRETTCNQPQRLFHLAVQTFASAFSVNASVPEEIGRQISCPGICDCCDGAVFGPGVRIIKPVEEIFGLGNIPVIFTVCTQTCRRAFKKNSDAVNNYMEKYCKESKTKLVESTELVE